LNVLLCAAYTRPLLPGMVSLQWDPSFWRTRLAHHWAHVVSGWVLAGCLAEC
jgi:hypothetical protein